MKRSLFYSCYTPRYDKEKKEGKELLPYVEQAIKYAAADGYEGIEILPSGELTAENAVEYAKKVRQTLDTEGVACSCFSYGGSMLNDPKTALSNLKKYVDVTVELGSPYFHHTFQCSFNRKPLPTELTIYQNAEKIFAELGRETAYYAGEKGITCIYEDQGLYVNTVERMGELMHKIGLPNIGVCLDVGNALDNDVLPQAFAGAFASITKHVHIKDAIRSNADLCPGEGWSASASGVWYKYCVPGTGVVDLERIFNILLLAGYDGYFSLENQNAIYNLTNEQADADIAVSFKNIQKAYDRAKASIK